MCEYLLVWKENDSVFIISQPFFIVGTDLGGLLLRETHNGALDGWVAGTNNWYIDQLLSFANVETALGKLKNGNVVIAYYDQRLADCANFAILG